LTTLTILPNSLKNTGYPQTHTTRSSLESKSSFSIRKISLAWTQHSLKKTHVSKETCIVKPTYEDITDNIRRYPIRRKMRNWTRRIILEFNQNWKEITTESPLRTITTLPLPNNNHINNTIFTPGHIIYIITPPNKAIQPSLIQKANSCIRLQRWASFQISTDYPDLLEKIWFIIDKKQPFSTEANKKY